MNTTLKNLLPISLALLFTACSHPLEIKGQGDIVSNSGSRNCSMEEAPCANIVTGDYNETYTAVPRAGWQFDEWNGCNAANECTFTVRAEVVDNNWFQTAPALVANFSKIDSPNNANIIGFTGITHAVEVTGEATRYDVGGGNNHASELDGVPWQTLKPGDVVNIFHRAEPYRHKILLSEQGTAENPITINGVTNSSGERPTLTAVNAVSVNPNEWDSDYAGALMMINRRHSSGSYGQNAEHYVIKNLRMTGVRASNSYTHNGVTESYYAGGRAIWSAGGQYITLEGMVFEDNGCAVFIQANDDPGSLSKSWTIRGSKFENNGYHNRDHQIYFQAVSEPGEYNIVEGNYFGPPTPGQESIAQLKMRSTGTVVRYNWFNSAHRTLDIVEAQDAIPNWMYDNYTSEQILRYYRSSYVYGNIFVNDHYIAESQPATRALHFGADSFDEPATFSGFGSAVGELGMRGYEAPTYFFHNTVYNRADSSDMWRGSLFDLENNNAQRTGAPGSVDAWNNIFHFEGTTRIGDLNRTGTLNYRGANLVYTDTLSFHGESDSYANNENGGDDPNVNIVNHGLLLTANSAFADGNNMVLDAKDFSLLEDSPALSQAIQLPQELNEFPVEYQPAGIAGGAIARGTTRHLGALE